jgi:hypothetical protein
LRIENDATDITGCVADEYHRPARRQDAVQLARHDESLERRQQAHEVHVGGCQAVFQRLARLIL